jgi:hypothetical protein
MPETENGNELVEQVAKMLREISALVEGLPDGVYAEKMDLLGGSSIGEHIRHVVEFYIAVVERKATDVVCYDDRKRDHRLETEVPYAIECMNAVAIEVRGIVEDVPLSLWANYFEENQKATGSATSLFRELTFVLDHAVHHLSIVKIALIAKGIAPPANLGLAPSTLRHRAQAPDA